MLRTGFLLLMAAVCVSSAAASVGPCAPLEPRGCVAKVLGDEAERCVAGWNAKARCEAEHLPVDYREIVFVVLADFLRPLRPPNPDVDLRLQVYVFGDQLEVALRDRLRDVQVLVTSPTSFEHATDNERQTFTYHVDVAGIRKTRFNRYQLFLSYNCGVLCAGGIDYLLYYTAEGWQIVDRHQAWIS